MEISKITNTAVKYGNKLASSVGSGFEKAPKLQKAIKIFEPNGGDNSFFGLAGIMVGAVLIPRVLTAAKRNPDNKEATKDEIKEILFRDVQTILIMLFGLKILNSGIGNIATKMSGVPMVNRPFEKMFNSTQGGLKGLQEKGLELIQHPIEKSKTLLKNVGLLLNPIGGSMLSTGDEINSRFTKYASCDEVKKFLNDLENHGGDKEKVYKKIIKTLIDNQDKELTRLEQKAVLHGKKLEEVTEHASTLKIKEKLEKMLSKEAFENFIQDGKADKDVENLMINFFKNENNALVRSARNVKDWLRTLALAIEVIYLGFGLPALNQKRLEKKYLSEKPIGVQKGDTFTPINDRHIKAQEIKLYSSFIK